MDGGICSDRPFADYLFERHFAACLLLNPGRIRNVVIFLKPFGRKRQNSAARCASSLPTTTTNCSTRTGISAGFFPASLAPPSHSDLYCFQLRGSVMSPSPYWPACRIDFRPFAAVRRGIGCGGGS